MWESVLWCCDVWSDGGLFGMVDVVVVSGVFGVSGCFEYLFK